MKQAKLHGLMFVASLMAVVVLATAPVFAHRGEDDGDTSVSSSQEDSMSDDDSTPDTAKSDDGEHEHGPSEQEIEHGVLVVKQHGKKMLELRREGKQLKSKEQRQRTCQNIEKAVNNKLKAFNNHADKFFARLNTLFTDVQAYRTERNITLNDYDSLVAAANTKQTEAALAVATLKSLGDTINCDSSDPAGMLAGAKEAAGNARDALKEYRKSLKDLVVALVQAGKTDDTTDGTEGDN